MTMIAEKWQGFSRPQSVDMVFVWARYKLNSILRPHYGIKMTASWEKSRLKIEFSFFIAILRFCLTKRGKTPVLRALINIETLSSRNGVG